MVNGSQTVNAGNGGLPLFVRASAAAALSAESGAASETVAAQPVDQVTVTPGQAYRYNSFEFSYRQDFGKIVIVRQKPDTGELVQQFPSEYYLRKYADSERVARTAETYSAARTAKAAVANQDVATDAAVSPPASNSNTAPAPAIEAAPVVASAPALPSAAGASRVNLTI